MKRSLTLLLALSVATAVWAPEARAHFLFLLPAGPADRPVAHAVFSDALAPDRAELLAKVAHAEFTVLTAGGKATPVKGLVKGPAIEVPVAATPAVVRAVCSYGVFAKGKGEPFRLEYSARTVLAPPGKLPHDLLARRSDRSPLEVTVSDHGAAALVTWQGKPLADAEVAIYAPGGDEPTETKTDAKGAVALPKPTRAGTLGLRARHIEEKAGTLAGQEYKSTRHYATLTFPVAAEGKPAADKGTASPEATRLLADARAARAHWAHFPGFTAQAEVNVDGVVSPAELVVDARGKVTLDLKGETGAWAQRTLASVIGHRLDDTAELNSACAYLDEVGRHPLGRAIRVLDDEFHSSYRIRDRQVIEVNRTAGPVRFTISVTENRLNAEKKFLPVSYVVNTWDAKTEALKSSVTHHQSWERVGAYDLPREILVVSAGDGRQVARSITLSGWKLRGRE